jgi:hypothetical protein
MFIRFVGALILIGLLVASGYAVYQAGFAQGAVAQLPPGDAVGRVAPYPYPHYGFYPFFGFGLFFKIAIFFFLFFFVSRLLMFGAWALMGGPRGKYWRRGWGHHPGWHWHDDEGKEEDPEADDERSAEHKH